jgi:hypothetical protein
MALLYGSTGRLAPQNGGFRPWETPPHDELKEWSGQLEPEPEPEGNLHRAGPILWANFTTLLGISSQGAGPT